MAEPQYIPETLRHRSVTLGVPLLAFTTIILILLNLKVTGDQTRTNEERRLSDLEERHEEQVAQLHQSSHHLLNQLIDIGKQLHADHSSPQAMWPAIRLPAAANLPGLQALLVYDGKRRCYPVVSLTEGVWSDQRFSSWYAQQHRLFNGGRTDQYLRNRAEFFNRLTSPLLSPGLENGVQFLLKEHYLIKGKPQDSRLNQLSQQDSLLREQMGHALLIKFLEWDLIRAVDRQKKDSSRHYFLLEDHLIVAVQHKGLHTIAIWDRTPFYRAMLAEWGAERRGNITLQTDDTVILRASKEEEQLILKEIVFDENTLPIRSLRSYRPTPDDLRRGAEWLGFLQKALLVTVLLTLYIALFTAFRSLYREKRLLELKANFLNSVSHELKTPLTSIRLFADTLSTGRIATVDKTVTYARMIQKESARLEQLVEDILNYNRLEQGISKEQFRLIDLCEKTREMIRRYEPIAQTRGVSLSFTGERETLLHAEPRSLESLIGNLIDNAIKYTPSDGEVNVVVEKRGNRGVLVVSDTGIGIPAEEQDKIYEVFYRVGDEMVRHTTGSGLGLAIVQRSAKLHNAHISLHSTPEKGTIFTITFGEHNV